MSDKDQAKEENQEMKLTPGVYIGFHLWLIFIMGLLSIGAIRFYIHQDKTARAIQTIADTLSLSCTTTTNDFNHQWLESITMTPRETKHEEKQD